MTMQLERIKEKLKHLKRLDTGLTVFGASKHGYKVNRPLRMDTIKQFEIKSRIKLPEEYVSFLTQIGNGGAGPFYGLEPLENSLFQDLDYKKPGFLLNPSTPFAHTSSWNMKFQPTVNEQEDEQEYEKQYEAFQEEYYDPKHLAGVIAICNFGCAVSLHLVVNGKEYGNIWTDDRSSDYGIHPSQELGNTDRITFLDWYERWLDNSTAELNDSKS
jgi:hypothetical protein